jgi:glycosyltransferase involved in cell wall biosynthesis
MAFVNVTDDLSYERRVGDRRKSSGIHNERRMGDRRGMGRSHNGHRVGDRRSIGLAADPIEISVVMPCLNEEESVGICVKKALEGLAASGMVGEVIVSDNGSTDRSVEVARAAGASVVIEAQRGYGNAYMRGFSAATGRIIIMGDSDDSYDFTQLGSLIDKIGEGYDYVLGSRFDGEIRKGAMTWSHRYIGNPILTAVLNRFFGLQSSDAHSGMRAFTREALDRMALRCEGMEFASEIVVKAAQANLRVAEVPIVYHPRVGESKLNSLRDGWRHLRFMLLLAPTYLFLVPGLALLALGLLGQGFVLTEGRGGMGTNFSVLSALLALTGVVIIIFGVLTHTFLESLGFGRSSRLSNWVDQRFSLEGTLVIALGTMGLGLAVSIYTWAAGTSDNLDAEKWVVASVMLIAIGLVVIFGSFFLSIFKVRTQGLRR